MRTSVLALVLLVLPSQLSAKEPPLVPSCPGLGQMLWDDIRWTGRSVLNDAKAVVTSPLRIGKLRQVSWKGWLKAGLIVGSIGASIALDQPLRDAIKGMDDDAADTMQTVGSVVTQGALPVLYIGGLIAEKETWRRDALTGAESLAVVSGLVPLTKVVFGRQRPDTGVGPTAWFQGGQSFVSDAATPPFAAAEAVSHAFDYNPWVAAPMYASAVAVGLARMGRDRHWTSDIVGSAALGIMTTRLFNRMHRAREQESSGLALLPMAAPGGGVGLQLFTRF